MYTATADASWEKGWASLQPVSSVVFSKKRFDAVISVIGNSSHHFEIFDYLMSFGGAAIAHDARMLDFYAFRYGLEGAARVATNELRREVSSNEIRRWLNNEEGVGTLFLSQIINVSDPLIVHSALTVETAETLYGRRPSLLPYSQCMVLDENALSRSNRRSVRDSFGIRDNEVVLVSFGFVIESKAPRDLISALCYVRERQINARLVFCGQVNEELERDLVALSAQLGVEQYVSLSRRMFSPAEYRRYLVAGDIGIQLRKYGLGALSGALNDCMAAAMPTIANENLATSMDAPSFVRRVSDRFSAIDIAGKVIEIISTDQIDDRPVLEAQEITRVRSPAAYSNKLMQTLGFDLRHDS
jgi:glycosyltransferase involved in cell wall biosynthesis